MVVVSEAEAVEAEAVEAEAVEAEAVEVDHRQPFEAVEMELVEAVHADGTLDLVYVSPTDPSRVVDKEEHVPLQAPRPPDPWLLVF